VVVADCGSAILDLFVVALRCRVGAGEGGEDDARLAFALAFARAGCHFGLGIGLSFC
jgi:hypothetical protein